MVVVDTDYRAVGALLDGDLDEAWCEVCGSGLGFRQNLCVLLTDSRAALVAPGDGLRRLAETGWATLRRKFEEQLPSVQLIEMASAEAMRAEVWQRIACCHKLFENLERAKKNGQIPEWLSEHWREMTPAAFVAGALILGAKAHRRGEAQNSSLVETQARAMAEWQANVFLSLCREWAETPPEKGCFDDDLDGYLVASAIQPFGGGAIR